jgi:hypothetical protein
MPALEPERAVGSASVVETFEGIATDAAFSVPAASCPSVPKHPAASAESDDPLSPIHDPEAEIDLAPDVGQRFDEPTPSQLEVRGRCGQLSNRAFAAKMPAAQAEFWSSQTVFKNSVAAKLRIAGMPEFAAKLEGCHSEWTIAHCNDCGRERHFPNRCDLFCCPECTPRLGHERAESVAWWTLEVAEPKFVTLTVKNVPDLTRGHITEFRGWFRKLRHRKFAEHWGGGFYTFEVTNEGRGWHLHMHALIDARWIDGPELAQQWASVTNGAGRIVKVKDARRADYCNRVKTYIVKGSALAKWTPDQIATYVRAFDGVHTFGVFGSLYGKRTAFKEWLEALRGAKPLCECGSNDIRYTSELDALMQDLVPCNHAPNPPPAAASSPTQELFNRSETGQAAFYAKQG